MIYPMTTSPLGTAVPSAPLTSTDSAPAASLRDVVVPDKVGVEGLEDKWAPAWEEAQLHAFDRTASAEDGPRLSWWVRPFLPHHARFRSSP